MFGVKKKKVKRRPQVSLSLNLSYVLYSFFLICLNHCTSILQRKEGAQIETDFIIIFPLEWYSFVKRDEGRLDCRLTKILCPTFYLIWLL